MTRPSTTPSRRIYDGSARRSRPICDGPTPPEDSGRALIEVVFLAVLVLIPTVYIMIGVLRVQAATMAVAQAARDVGRLIETSTLLPSVADARAVAGVALADHNISGDGLRVVTAAPGGSCGDTAELTRRPGSDYDVCVIATIALPGVPSVLAGSANTVTGVYTVHIDELREGR